MTPGEQIITVCLKFMPRSSSTAA